MPNTYTQLHYHILWAVKGRRSLIHPRHQEQVNKYVTGIVKNLGQDMIAVNGVPDHIHMVARVAPNMALSDFIGKVKANSSRMISENGLSTGSFEWQRSFAAFAVSKSDLPRVIKYVMNQPEHHRVKTFEQEYLEWLKAEEIDFNPDYLFEPVKFDASDFI